MSTDDVMNNARKTARSAQAAASDQFDDMQDSLITYTREQPVMALLSAFVLGIVVGKIVL